MCFFLMLGIVPREREVGTQMRYCVHCGRDTLHTLYERRNYFMLFFIPLFPVGYKREIARCGECGGSLPVGVIA